MAARQMLVKSLQSAKISHLARTHLFLTPSAGLGRNKFWMETMESDVLVFDFQDGCPPGERGNVMEGLSKAQSIYPNKPLSIRLTELERDENGSIYEEIRASLDQKQVYWLMLPMCDTLQCVEEYMKIIDSIDSRWFQEHGALQIISETPRGLHNLPEMLDACPQIKGVVTGGGDYLRFAQGSQNVILANHRWEVLNACLQHGRMPIDSPPLSLGLSDGKALCHFQSGFDSGFRSSVMLHPEQVTIANEIFSPSSEEALKDKMSIGPWLEGRETGYRKGSKDDFIGPPHMKQKLWATQYHCMIQSKKVVHSMSIDHSILSKAGYFLSMDKTKCFSVNGDSNNRNHFLNMLNFLVMSTCCHPRHKDLLFNLGFSSVVVSKDMNGNPRSYEDASFVSSQIVGRRITSSGDLIVVYKVHILDSKHQTLCELERKFLERKLPFDEFTDEGLYPHVENSMINGFSHTKTKDVHKMIESATIMHSQDFTTIDLKRHNDYCSILGLDAPVHRNDSPAIASTLHLSHHALNSISTLDMKHYEITDCVFHSPMKPDAACKRMLFDFDGKILSVIQDTDGTLLSSVQLSSIALHCDAEKSTHVGTFR